MRILVTTPTGNTGNKIANRLLDIGGNDVVLLARDPGKLEDEAERGAEIVQGDLGDARLVREALAGADALFLACPPSLEAPGLRAFYGEIVRTMADAIAAAATPHTVLLSSVGAQLSRGTGPILGLHDAEETLAEVTAHLTCLRPTFFMENFLAHTESISGMDSIFLPLAAATRLPMIATADIAKRAVEALLDPPPAAPTVVPLLGPAEYTFGECAEEIGKRLGRAIAHVRVTREEAGAALRQAGASDAVVAELLEMYAGFESGLVIDGTPRSAESTTPTTFAAFVDGTLAPALEV